MSFDLDVAAGLIPLLGPAALKTFLIAIVSSALAVSMGFAFELVRRSSAAASAVMGVIVDLIRSTPILVQLYFAYFVLPAAGIRLPALMVGIGVLGLYYSGYLAEVFKGGIDAVPKGQVEAGKALGLRRLPIICLIVAPQVLRAVAPAVGNYFVSILKATPYLAVIAVPEMLGQALDYAADSFRYLEPLTVVGAMFLILSLTIAKGVRALELKLKLPGR